MSQTGLILFALHASHDFGQRVSDALGIPLAPHEEREFEDGEHKARPLVSVRGADVYVLHSLYGDSAQSGNDKLLRLLFFIGALKDAAAARITAVVPYLAYARKDRKSKPRDPVTTRYVASLFEAVGTDVVMTLDVHNLAAFQNAYRCRTEHLEAAPLLVAHLAAQFRHRELVVVSPDAGGIKRAEHFRQQFFSHTGNLPSAGFTEKYRSGGQVSGAMLVGEVSGKAVIIVDDLISRGTTAMRTALACRERGAACVVVAASHGLFAADAADVLADAALEKILVTDSVPARSGQSRSLEASKIERLSCAALFAQAIHRSHFDESFTALAEG